MGKIRLVTYNVHGCVGRDGVLSPARVADAIAPLDPDVVALQELDVARVRSGRQDQPRLIAERLEMEAHFHPALTAEDEHYGNAVLSRRPMRLVRAGGLPNGPKRHVEPRDAQCAAIDVDGSRLNVLTTHLGLGGSERVEQVESLLGDGWLRHPDCAPPVVLCGDLNAIPGTRAYRRMAFWLRDAWRVNGARGRATWPARWPVFRIDHVFVSDTVRVEHVEVVATDATRVASDHLPILACLAFP